MDEVLYIDKMHVQILKLYGTYTGLLEAILSYLPQRKAKLAQVISFSVNSNTFRPRVLFRYSELL